jgi:hypothetical protein
MKKVFLAGFLALAPVAGLFAGSPTLKNVSGSLTTSGNTTIVAAVTRKRIMVTSYLVISTAATTNVLTFQDGAGGSALWTIPVVTSSTSTPFGANLAVPHKQGAIFGTGYGSLLNLNLSASQPVTYSIGYYEED